MKICEQCGSILIENVVDRILAEREEAIKRMNKRRGYASKEKRSKKRS